MSEVKPVAFTVALKNFFGYMPGKGAAEFMTELKALSYEDKVEFARMLRDQAGIPCTDPLPPVAK